MKEKLLSGKRTIVKKMSNKDLLNVLWLFENCKSAADVDLTKLPDLSECNQDNLNVISKQSFRLSNEQKAIFDRYFYQKPYSHNFKEMLNVVNSMVPVPVSTTTTTVTTTTAAHSASSGSVAGVVAISSYLYDPNQPVEVSNFNAKLCLDDVVNGKITTDDVCDMFGTKYLALMSKKPDQFKDLGKDYLEDIDFAGCLMTANQKAGQLKYYLELPEPSLDDTLTRFTDYLKRNITSPVQTIDSVDFADEMTVADDRIQFADSEGVLGEMVYSNKKDMINDVLYYGLSLKLDNDTQFSILGKQYTLKALVKDYYKKYPNGFNTDFFKSAREAYEMGKLEL